MSELKFKRLAIKLDCARNGRMKNEMIKKYIDIIAKMGFTTLFLYLEDMIEIEGEPYFGYKRGRFTVEEFQDLDNYAKSKGIELCPGIQIFAHNERIKRYACYQDIFDIDDILLCDYEKTYEFIEKIFATVRKGFSSNLIHIHYDEAGMVGRGKHLDKYGYQEPIDIALRHLNRVCEIGRKYGYEEMLAGNDTFIRVLNNGDYGENVKNVPTEVKEQIPDMIRFLCWEYFSTVKSTYEKSFSIAESMKPGIWYNGAMYSWQGYTPNNTFSMQAIKTAFDVCFERGVENAIICTFGDTGNECSFFSLLPCMYYISQLAHGNNDLESIKKGFYEMFSIEFDTFLLLDLPGTPNTEYHPNTPSEHHKILNCERHFIYNDCFYGLVDNIDRQEYADSFKMVAKKLDEAVVTEEYAYLFEWIRDLCNVLEYKSNLGNKTREAYLNKDMKALKSLLPIYDEVIKRMEIFYKSFERRWMHENLSYGFEVHDLRIGGLIKRITHCKEIIERYINGKIDKIEQLDDPVLDIWCRENDNTPVGCLDWKPFYTTSFI